MVESNYKFFGFGLRSAQEVGKRVIGLHIAINRATIETFFALFVKQGERESFLNALASIDPWPKTDNFTRFMTLSERMLYMKQIGTWTITDRHFVPAWNEALTVLLWGLGKFDQLESGELLFSFEEYGVCSAVENPDQFLSKLNLRSKAELARELHHATWMAMFAKVEGMFLSDSISFGDYRKSIQSIKGEYQGMRLAGSQFREGENLLENPFVFNDPADTVLILENALTRQRTLGWILNRVAYWDLTGGYSENCISHCPPITNN